MLAVSFNTFNYKQPAFSGRKEVMEKSEKFSNDAVKLSHSKRFNDENIRELVRIYIPNLIIRKKTSEAEDEKKVAGAFRPDFQYGAKSKRYVVKARTIFLRPISSTNMPKSEYVKALTHEMTHAFQADDNDISDAALMNKSLKFVDEDTCNKRMIEAFSIWTYFEDVLMYPLMDGINSTITDNQGIFPYKISIDDKKMKECIDDIFQEAKKKFTDTDIEFVKNFIKLQLIHEADAYRAGQKALKKFKKEPLRAEDEIIPTLYENVAKCMK